MLVFTKEFDDLYKLTNNAIKVMQLEQMIYAIAKVKSDGIYKSGLWTSKVIEIDPEEKTTFWFFNLNSEDDHKTFTFPNENRQRDEQVSVKCFSMLCTLFAFGEFMAYNYQNDKLENLLEEIHRLYYAIRANADKVLSEEEANIFWSIID